MSRAGSSWTARIAAALTLTAVLALSGCGNHGQGRAIWVAPPVAATVSTR